MVTDTTPKVQDTTPKVQDTTRPSKVVEPSPVSKESSHVTREPSPAPEPKTHTEKEVNQLLLVPTREAGRMTNSAESERDSLKVQLASMTSERDDIHTERTTLEKRIEELSSTDPELNNLEKRAKELREQDRLLKDGIRTLASDKMTNAERVKKAELASANHITGECEAEIAKLTVSQQAAETKIAAQAKAQVAKNASSSSTAPTRAGSPLSATV